MTTIDETHQPDDAELDAFLRGEDNLSPRLKRLSQPSPPPEVTAAVMAEIETALAQEKNASSQAANDGNSYRSSRWAMPVAFAASVLFGVMIHTQWRAAQDRGEAAVAQATADIPSHSAVPENEPAPRDEAAMPSGKSAQMASPAGPAPKIAPLPPVASAETQTVTTTGIRASLQQSLNVKRKANTVVEVITAEDIGKMPDKNVADSLQRVPGVNVAEASKENPPALEQKRQAVNDIDVIVNDDRPSMYGGMPEKHANAAALAPPAPAAAAPSMLPVEEPHAAKVWLDRIEKKLEAGEEREALEEWAKFRKAYPDFAVPDKLAEKIKALQQK